MIRTSMASDPAFVAPLLLPSARHPRVPPHTRTAPSPAPRFATFPIRGARMSTSAPSVPSQELTRMGVMLKLGDESIQQLVQALKVTKFDVQQSLNCCGFTSLAYAFTAMGCPTTVDDLFHTLAAPVESAVGDGMTLSEIYDAAQRYVARANLPLTVECTHFDSFSVAVESFRKAAAADSAAGMRDLYILNFHSGIAHGWESGGGGHFSVLAGLDKDTDAAVVADVHGEKYGTYWCAPVAQIHAAMADKDSCGRARGALRFVKRDKRAEENMLPRSLVDWNAPPAPFSAATTQKYVPQRWDAGLGTKNMEGASAIAAAMRVLEGGDHVAATLDGVMHTLHESYTWHLDNFLTGEKVGDMLQALQDGEGHKSGGKAASVKRVALGMGVSGASVKKALVNAGCGGDDTVVLAAFDINAVMGAQLLPPESGEAGVLTHGPKTWALLAGIDAEADKAAKTGVLVAPTHNVVLAGRMWACSFDGLAAGMRAIGEVTLPEIIVMSK